MVEINTLNKLKTYIYNKFNDIMSKEECEYDIINKKLTENEQLLFYAHKWIYFWKNCYLTYSCSLSKTYKFNYVIMNSTFQDENEDENENEKIELTSYEEILSIDNITIKENELSLINEFICKDAISIIYDELKKRNILHIYKQKYESL